MCNIYIYIYIYVVVISVIVIAILIITIVIISSGSDSIILLSLVVAMCIAAHLGTLVSPSSGIAYFIQFYSILFNYIIFYSIRYGSGKGEPTCVQGELFISYV